MLKLRHVARKIRPLLKLLDLSMLLGTEANQGV
jgi:hypothetical protein